ncbi:MAG: DUF4091 domain-containing protein [Clostridia bacterium]|nr:DUF4091 domain-containing protein [Clostridia bacterium]
MRVFDYSGSIRLKLLDDLVKVFLDEEPVSSLGQVGLSVLRNDRLSFQLAYIGTGDGRDRDGHFHSRFVQVKVDSPIADVVAVRTVENVPCQYVAHTHADNNYLRKAPGLYPDLLVEDASRMIAVTDCCWKSLWIDVEIPEAFSAGKYPIEFHFDDPQSGERLASARLEIEVLPFALPEQILPRTEWFHADCLADYYDVPVFSEAHWAIMRNFLKTAVKRGINMILTPQFTPPLDTAVGWERTTVQLVEVWKENGDYRFDFSNMRRWIELCLECGVRYFEMSHLFSQWGAVAAPKIVGYENGEKKILFGWDTPAVGGEYTRFLMRYLPQLRALLQEYNIEDRCYFHISDEPHQSQLESYRAAKESVKEALEGCKFFEAISDYDFYSHGLIDYPVCATNHIETFLEHDTQGLWSYYCTGQSVDVSNCFIGQSSGRTRVYGAQLFKFNIAGSLRWGYNFYNTAFSYFRINPFISNDASMTLPAGDAFIVYPGPKGVPQESIRMVVLDDAIRDYRALTALAEKIGREKTIALMEEGLSESLRFSVYPDYPNDAPYVLKMRERVNRALCENM